LLVEIKILKNPNISESLSAGFISLFVKPKVNPGLFLIYNILEEFEI